MWNLLPDAAEVFDDHLVRESLNRYFTVMQNRKQAKFKIAQKVLADFSQDDTLEVLWREHDARTEEFRRTEKEIDATSSFDRLPAPEKSYYNLKLLIANRIMQNCRFCSRKCSINRTLGKLGYCKCGAHMAVSSIFAHFGEESELVPSGTVFTMGCTIRCKHCQNWIISQWIDESTKISPEGLAKEVDHLRSHGCRNANLVGGEPTPWLFNWLQTFKHVKLNVPVVWNSNSYYSPETAKLLAGFADVYLLDFKYGPNNCAERISEATDYWTSCTLNHLEANKSGELIIRVLVLPGHTDCCTKPILSWISENLGAKTRVNVMFQYRPEWRANEIPELRRRLNTDEKKKAVQAARKAGLNNFIT